MAVLRFSIRSRSVLDNIGVELGAATTTASTIVVILAIVLVVILTIILLSVILLAIILLAIILLTIILLTIVLLTVILLATTKATATAAAAEKVVVTTAKAIIELTLLQRTSEWRLARSEDSRVRDSGESHKGRDNVLDMHVEGFAIESLLIVKEGLSKSKGVPAR